MELKQLREEVIGLIGEFPCATTLRNWSARDLITERSIMGLGRGKGAKGIYIEEAPAEVATVYMLCNRLGLTMDAINIARKKADLINRGLAESPYICEDPYTPRSSEWYWLYFYSRFSRGHGLKTHVKTRFLLNATTEELYGVTIEMETGSLGVEDGWTIVMPGGRENV